MMSKILKVLGVLLLIIIFIIVALIVTNIYYDKKNSKDSQQFALDAMKAIASTWDKQEVLNRYNPSIKPKIDLEALEKSLFVLKKDGVLKGEIKNINGNLIMIKSFEGNPNSTAVYNGEINLDNGNYVMRLYLSRWDSNWCIDQIDVCDKKMPESLENCKITSLQMSVQ